MSKRNQESKDMRKQGLLTYKEAVNQVIGGEPMTIHYDGIARTGYWFEDHMMNMFSDCKLVKIGRNLFQVVKWKK